MNVQNLVCRTSGDYCLADYMDSIGIRVVMLDSKMHQNISYSIGSRTGKLSGLVLPQTQHLKWIMFPLG
ncbi:hypothetical protein MFUM_800014 [Methylacidiphilum fumariolicum SolV]|uniref:Uncharacterized protein n=2 Tax=Candidatus Methylacidiphilum fumarolicum TaxID=591154 RepID=I0JZY1_METFB|nr:conserved protein of unknown function [Candidatus Methylacidiphilum fumarolicum]CCG92800.1 hypothetical protein MFUM_800014 [Methylacidiphilum fumariolicum SolV]